jgi:TolB-like protein/DNA-binding winged helix-turn-helix (wHTH) protein/Tfp pilus assembly protein PilF
MPGADVASRATFGVFELELQTGELRKSGTLVHLPPQPCKVLSLLVSRSGQLVTRDEIRREIWGEETFVDFEHGLNFAINKIREALGDNAGTPRYIETVPRRGYRFIAPVEWRTASRPSHEERITPEPHPDASDARAEGREISADVAARMSRKSSFYRQWVIALGGGVIILACALLLALNVSDLRDRAAAVLHFTKLEIAPITSIAVLPLENLSQDPEQEYFADGLTDTLITNLGQVTSMRVISRASVIRYKRGDTPLPQISRELNVDAVVEGTILRSGERIRISVQLLDARADRHLWAKSYDRPLGDLIELEKRVALEIAHEISGRLHPAQEIRLRKSGPLNLQAYDAYMRGRYLIGERTPEAERDARGYFEEALRADPKFALAYAGLAEYYSVSWNVTHDDLPLGEQYARKAVALDAELAEAHAALGITRLFQHDFNEGGAELQRAITLNSNYAMARHWYAFYFMYRQDKRAALAENDRALQLDPFSFPVNLARGILLEYAREPERAAEQLEKLSALNPAHTVAPLELIRVYWILGKAPEALAAQKRVASMVNDAQLARDAEEVAGVYARAGLRAALLRNAQLRERTWERSRRNQTREFFPPNAIAIQYALLRDREMTMKWLNEALHQDDDRYEFDLLCAPELDFVRSDPEFKRFLRVAGLRP